MDDLLIKFVNVRHLESLQNRKGRGEADTNLTEEGKATAQYQRALLRMLGHIDYFMTGDLKRHEQTFEENKSAIKSNSPIIQDKRLNAYFSGQLLSQPAKITEMSWGLDRFKPGSDGLYHGEVNGKEISFDPVESGIYPYDPLYSRALLNKDLRSLVFGNEPTLTSFDTIDKSVKGLQKDIIQRLDQKVVKPITILAISSCSPAGFNLEYAAFDTIGYNMHTPFGSQGKNVFPLDHDELMILGYTREDFENKKQKLRPVEGNIKIVDYLNK